MRVLLDTNSVLSLGADDSKLSERAESIFLDGTNEVLHSAAIGLDAARRFV